RTISSRVMVISWSSNGWPSSRCPAALVAHMIGIGPRPSVTQTSVPSSLRTRRGPRSRRPLGSRASHRSGASLIWESAEISRFEVITGRFRPIPANGQGWCPRWRMTYCRSGQTHVMIRPMDPVGGRVPLWEEQALERSLGPARARSAALVRRLVDAARALAADVGPDFTVPQVAAKAGVSLKTLYRCFSGKDALLLAVFEEDNRVAADLLAGMMAGSDDPLERLRAFITGLFELSTASPSEGYILLVMREYFRLAQHHSEGVEHVL